MPPQPPPTSRTHQIRQPNLLGVFLVCLAAIAGLFLAYEVVERTWLREAGPEVIRALHVIRGVSAALIACVLAAVVILRQTYDAAAETILPVLERSWLHRLQNVRLRAKIAAPMVTLAVLPALTTGVLILTTMQSHLKEGAAHRVEFDTVSKARALQEFLKGVQQDLRFLSRIPYVQKLADAEASGAGGTEALRRRLEEEFLVFSQGKRTYYQVRYLDAAGRERVRLNLEGGRAIVVPRKALQDKGGRYYVDAALRMEPGRIYVSPMDLNMEHGRVETPARGVVRYAMGVSGERGLGRGLLIINIDAEFLLSLAGPLGSGFETWLLDQDGTYLGYLGSSPERREAFGMEKRRSLSEDHSAQAVRAILEPAKGGVFAGGGHLLSSAPVAPDEGRPERRWTLLVGQPQGPILGPIRHLTISLAVVLAVVVALAAMLGLLLGDYLARPIVQLQRATREIAEGRLDKQVHIQTGDEIERLAHDFNVMTASLREAKDQLSKWNRDLQAEVERQTATLHAMQSGLARADKLASIGQITAGVLHEVGNPLAAIKTKIQVAEEDPDLCQDCHALMQEVLSEVDRLAGFLRGFSRLSRLGAEPRRDEVSMADVAQGVVSLVSAELRRKGMRIRAEVLGEAPTVSGIADQLRQVVMNLVLNAADASAQGQEILLRVQAQGARAALKVVDHGRGIPVEILDRIWDPFFTTKPEGSGLGLAICRQIIQAHGGEMRVDSSPGKGTTVTLTLPRYEAEP